MKGVFKYNESSTVHLDIFFAIQNGIIPMSLRWHASDPALILHFNNSNKHLLSNSKTAKHDQIDLPAVELYHWTFRFLTIWTNIIFFYAKHDQIDLPAVELTDLHSIWKLPRAWLPCENALICYISNNFGQRELRFLVSKSSLNACYPSWWAGQLPNLEGKTQSNQQWFPPLLTPFVISAQRKVKKISQKRNLMWCLFSPFFDGTKLSFFAFEKRSFLFIEWKAFLHCCPNACPLALSIALTIQWFFWPDILKRIWPKIVTGEFLRSSWLDIWKVIILV